MREEKVGFEVGGKDRRFLGSVVQTKGTQTSENQHGTGGIKRVSGWSHKACKSIEGCWAGKGGRRGELRGDRDTKLGLILAHKRQGGRAEHSGLSVLRAG